MIEVKLPRSIKIAGTDYKIKSDPKTDRDLDAHQWKGSSSPYEQEIEISTRSLPQQFSETFIHEVLHRVDGHYNNNKLDEGDIDRLSNGLHQVLEQLGIRFVRR